MGRQQKTGLDFWLRDVRLFQDQKLRVPRQKFGYLAPFIYECLLDILYGDKGYYIDYRGEQKNNVLWQLMEMTQGKYSVSIDTLGDVVDSLAASGLFSGDLFKLGIITSVRAQKGYFSATLKRVNVPINYDIWLLSEEEMRELNPSGSSYILRKFISPAETPISPAEIPISPAKSTQSRLEKSKSREDDISLVTAGVEKTLGEKLNKSNRRQLEQLLEQGAPDELVLDTARYAVDHARDDKKAAYFMVVLRERVKGADKPPAVKRDSVAKRLYIDQTPPIGPLADWEERWLKSIREHKKGNTEGE